MRIAILTDIHSNREALSACLAHAEARQAEQYAFLGDFVGYGADPVWVIDTVSAYCERGARAVLGNHDAAVMSDPSVYLHPEARRAVDWTRAQLSQKQLDFLADLPRSIEAGDCLFVHASAANPLQWDYVTNEDEAVRSMDATSCRVTFCGHVHEPALYQLSMDGQSAALILNSHRMVLDDRQKWLAIAGSVGQPRDRNPAACYAMYDDVSREISFFRVPYDVAAAAGKILDARLPTNFAWRLAEGM